jgi:hypothetical protein
MFPVHVEGAERTGQNDQTACTWSGSAIKQDIIATPGVWLELGTDSSPLQLDTPSYSLTQSERRISCVGAHQPPSR